MSPIPARTEVLSDPDRLAGRVAAWMTQAALAGPEPFRIALSGGSTPKRLYELLASSPFVERFPWPKVEWWWGDERFVPADDPASNYRMAREAMLDRAPAPSASVHPVPTDGAPDDAARRYEQELKAAYGADTLDPARPLFEIVLLGLGADGHTASLLPGDPALEEQSRWVVAVSHGRPETRITLTYPAIASSRRVAFLVEGAEKAAIFKAVRSGASDAPAARVRTAGELVWFVDAAARGLAG